MSEATVPPTTPVESGQLPEASSDNAASVPAAATEAVSPVRNTDDASVKVANEHDSIVCSSASPTEHEGQLENIETTEMAKRVENSSSQVETSEVLVVTMTEGDVEVQEMSIDIGAELSEVPDTEGDAEGSPKQSGDTKSDEKLKENESVSKTPAVAEVASQTAAAEDELNEPCNFRVVAVDVTDDVNTRANTDRIQNVENCFGSSGQSLKATGRVLVGEGVLTKLCRKKPKPRQVFLFNDILVYGNILIPKKKYTKQHIIPLEKVSLENIDESADISHGWVIRTPTKSFVVCAASKTEKQQWMSHINTCINELLKKTGKHPSKEHAAVWVPDSGAERCMVCKDTKFTLLNRRHHCRKCGCVVCGNCSQHKFMLPAQSSKPLRVCDTCYNTLSMGKGDFAEIDLSAVPSAPESKPPTSSKDDSRTASGKEQLSLSRDDTTDESDDDEDDVPEQTAEQAQLKEEKPTFYSGDDANKEASTEEESGTIAKDDATKKDEACSQAEEKFDAMKITADESTKTN